MTNTTETTATERANDLNRLVEAAPGFFVQEWLLLPENRAKSWQEIFEESRRAAEAR